jgi:hypothetical protein
MSRIRANNIVNGAGTGAPTFPNGAVINGITTITADVATTGNNLTIGTGTTISNPSDNEFRILTNGGERVRVDSSGNVGIGTDNPAVHLDVYGEPPRIRLVRNSTGVRHELRGNADNLSIRADHSNIGADTRIDFQIDGSEKLRILSTGGITFNGDTSVNNALDDYEEGSWTPTYYGASTAGTYTLTSTNAKYTKIGNTVHLYVDIKNINEDSAGTGLLRIGGLPFTPSNGNEAGSVILEAFSFPSTVEYAVLRTSTLNHLTVVGVRNSGVDIQFNVADRDSNTSDIFGQITYMTSA